MKRLHLLRHAKSSWDAPLPADLDRPLAPRGRRASADLARWLATSGIRPQLALCSTALRARQTLDAVLGAFPDRPAVTYDDALYGAGAEDLLHRIGPVPTSVTELLVVGHNPGLHDLAVALGASGDERLIARLRAKLPTGALVTLHADVDSWTDLRGTACRLESFVAPRELRGA